MTNDKCDDWIHWESHQVYIKSIKYMFANPQQTETIIVIERDG